MKEQKKTALDYFQSGEPQIIRHLQIRLQDLLSGYDEPYVGVMKEYGHLRFDSFRDHFEWEETYSVRITYTFSGLSWESVECEDREEALEIVAGVTDPYVEVESPEEIDVIEEVRKIRVKVSNLRLKESCLTGEQQKTGR